MLPRVFVVMTKLVSGFGQSEVVWVMVPNDRVIYVERVG